MTVRRDRGFGPLSMGALPRLVAAGALSGLLWLGAFWAMGTFG